jgi:hypothetical protein
MANELESAIFERDLARQIQRRLEIEVGELRDEVKRLRAALDEREQQLANINRSRGWRMILKIRELRERVLRR